MRENFIKYIFILVILGLISYGVYNVIKQGNEPEEIEVAPQEIKTTILNEIRYGICGLDTINPILSNNRNVQEISKLIYEPLLNITEDYKITTCLAKEVTKLNGTSYLIKLRDDVVWQDGNKFTSEDVRFTVDRLKDTASIYSLNVSRVSEVQVIDDTTVRINLFEEIPFFEYNLTFPIMSNTYYLGEDFANTPKNSTPVGTGKYKISDIADKRITLKQNQNWWNINNEECKIQTIYLNLYNSMGEVYNDFKLGSLDLITTNSSNYEDHVGTIGYNKKEFKQREFDFLVLNAASPFLGTTEERQAISYAIDKNNAISIVYQNKNFEASFPLDYGSFLYNEEGLEHIHDSNKVSELLEHAGWENVNNSWQVQENRKTTKFRINFVVNASNEQRRQVAENIAGQLENEGIEVNLIEANDNTYQTYLANKDYDMILTGRVMGYSPNLSTFFGENNLANYYNNEINTINADLKNIANDENLLKEKFRRLAEINNQEKIYIGLYRNRGTVLYSSNLMGNINPNSYNIFYNIGGWYREY